MRRTTRSLRAAAVALAVGIALAGCASNDPLAEQYGSGQGYISGDGAYTELPVAERGEPVSFTATTEYGDEVSSEDFLGDVWVVNFWYAGCPPCRLEAPDLAQVSTDYPDVPFLGVNTQDDAAQAITFAEQFGVPYPSVLDAREAQVGLAFAGFVSPNAVPSTLVMDREGRVAGRISGILRDPSILEAMIDRVADEGS